MFRRFVLWLMCGLAAAAFTFFASAQTNGQLFFSASPIDPSDAKLPADAVLVQKVGDEYCLFLPGAFGSGDLYACGTGFSSVTVGNRAYKPDEPVSGIEPGTKIKITVGSWTRTVRVYQGSNIRAVFLNTDSGSFDYVNKSKSNEEAGSLLVLTGGGLDEYRGKVDKIRIRGNSTLAFSKKNYNIKLSEKADLGGMGKSKKWTLVSSVKDRSLLRNQIVFDMARYAGLKYTPDLVPCDVWLNHSYFGEYILTERIEIAKHRIDVYDLEEATEAVNSAKPETYPRAGAQKLKYGQFKYFDIPNDPEDITGGYILEYENYQPRYSGDPSAYTTTRGKVLLIKEPEAASYAQAQYISRFIQGYENAIFAPDGIDPDSGKHYWEFVDMESLVLKYILEEFSKNEDGNASSQYYFKPSDRESTVAFAGPAWDYDCTFGGYATSGKTTLLNAKGFYTNRANNNKYWWPQLYARPEFLAAVKAMWAERFRPAADILLGKEKDPAGVLRSIAEYADEIRASANMNFVRWPVHYSGENVAETGRSFSANVEYLSSFIQRRAAFLDDNWLK